MTFPITPVTLTAAQCPQPMGFSGFLRVYDGENTTGNAPVARRFLTPGTTAGIGASKLNANATMADLSHRYGGAGAYCVLYGLGLTGGGTLALGVAAGHAMIDGVVELATAQTLVVPDNQARIWIWLKQDGTLATTLSALSTPTGVACLLGSCSTSGGTITSVDYSGVLFAVGGRLERWTADLATPTDSPASSARFWTHALGGDYYWDGAKYWRSVGAMPACQTGIAAGQIEVVATGTQARPFGVFTVSGTLSVQGQVRIEQ